MNLVGNNWDKILDKEYHQEYFKKIVDFINKEYIEKTCYPPKSRILRALSLTDYDKIKVVILVDVLIIKKSNLINYLRI